MSHAENLLPEFETEMGLTRKLLERVPPEKADWKPHERSMTLGGLVTHLSNIPTWAAHTIDRDELDVAPPGQPPMRAQPVAPGPELLEAFDRAVALASKAIAGASDQHLHGNWSLLAGGKTLFTMPRTRVLRSFVLSHLIHHRGQLSVYLRLLDVPLPSIYGPTADESKFG